MIVSAFPLALVLVLVLSVFLMLLLCYKALKARISTQVQARYDVWRERELEAIRQQYQERMQKEVTRQVQLYRDIAQEEELRRLQECRENAQKEVLLQLQHQQDKEFEALRQQSKPVAQRLSSGCQEEESGLGQEAAVESRTAPGEPAAEQIVPFCPGFKYNPKDVRFLGTPVDFVVFEGCEEGAVRSITFVEVARNGSSRSPSAPQLRQAIEQRLVAWEKLVLTEAPSQHEETAHEPCLTGKSSRTCPACEKSNRAQAHFCGHCGASLERSL